MKNRTPATSAVLWLLLLTVLYTVSRGNYLLFHSLAEIFSIAVSWCIFLFAFNSRKYMEDDYFLFLGVAYLYIGFLDLLHTLAYSGMGVFPGYGADLSTQLWIATRYLESIALVLAPWFIARKVRPPLLFLPFTVLCALLLGSLFWWHNFPVCYVEGLGLTPFKKISEYLICLILAAALYILRRNKGAFEPGVLRLLSASVILTILSELFFTFYISVYGLFNLLGHFFKIISFYCIYRAIIATGLESPYSILLRTLKQKEDSLQKAHDKLEERVRERTAELRRANEDLRREIREKQEARLEVEKREAYLRAIFQAAENVAFILADTSTPPRIIEFSPGAEKIFGYSREEIISQPVTLLHPVPPDDKMHREIIEKVRKGETGFDGETVMTRKGGATFPALLHVEPVRNSLRETVALGVSIDITSRKEAEEEIRRAKVEWDRTFDSVSVLVTLLDQDLRIVRFNVPAGETFAPDSAEITGRYCYEIFHHRRDPCPGCPALASLRNLEPNEQEIDFKELGKTFQVTTSPVIEENGRVIRIVHIARDITEKKKLEVQLRQAQKMEAIGTLAGGIAHDFNNILTSIIGFAELVLDKLPADSQMAADQNMVLGAAERARQLISQILSFSRQTGTDMVPVRMQSITKEALKMLRASIPATIEIRQYINHECPPVMADPSQMHQLLMNLCTNAYQAMQEKGGSLAVSLREMEITRDDSHIKLGLAPGKYLKMEVSDTGPGIEKDIQERIFEPYYTTKKKGEGTGLGLSIVHGIVKNHGGHITVYSEPGQGTCFHIYLPCLKDEEAPIIEETGQPLQGGDERLLIVDDEEKIVQFLRRTLTDLGYQVTAFTDSSIALQTFKARPDQFDLLVTDMAMPGMTGIDLATEVNSIKNDLPIILCTGYSEQISRSKAPAGLIRELMLKPLTRKDIARTIRKALDSGRGPE